MVNNYHLLARIYKYHLGGEGRGGERRGEERRGEERRRRGEERRGEERRGEERRGEREEKERRKRGEREEKREKRRRDKKDISYATCWWVMSSWKETVTRPEIEETDCRDDSDRERQQRVE